MRQFRRSTVGSAVALTMLVAAWLCPARASAQDVKARVITIQEEEQRVETSEGVRFLFVGDDYAQQVTMFTELERNHRIFSRIDEVDVGLMCPGNHQVLLSDRFDAVFIGTPSKNCMISLNGTSGRVDIQATSGTEIRVGDVVLGSRGTQYGVTIGPDGTRAFVLDGMAVVSTRGTTWTVGQGQGIASSPGASPEPLSDTDFSDAGIVYARNDVRTSGLTGASATNAIDRMQGLYFQVFSQPQSTQARIELATAQLQLGLPPRNALYHVNRAEEISGPTVQTLLMRSEALTRTGQIGAAQGVFAQIQGNPDLPGVASRLGLPAIAPSQRPLLLTLEQVSMPSHFSDCGVMWHRVRASMGGTPIGGVEIEISVPNGRLSPGPFSYAEAESTARIRTDGLGDGYFTWEVPRSVQEMPMTAQTIGGDFLPVSTTLPKTASFAGC